MRRYSFILLILCLLAACGDDARIATVLNRADSLMGSRPDSALTLLDSALRTGDASDRQTARLRLRRLNAINKLDTVFTEAHVAQASELVAHFDRHGTPNERMLAHYLLGRTYADAGQAPQAIQSYLEAAECADTTSVDCDYKTLSRVYAQMAEVYYYQLLADKMILGERQALTAARKAKDTMLYIACYAMMAEGYDMKNMPDSALLMLTESHRLYKEQGADDLAAGLCCSMAEIYRKGKNYKRASELMHEYENYSGFFDSDGNIIMGKEMYYYCKGMLCLNMSDAEGAEYNFRKLLDNSITYNQKIAALDGLQKYYEISFNKDSLVKYVSLSDSFSSIAHNEVEIQKTLQVQSMYDYAYNERIANQKSIEAEIFRRRFILLCAFLVVLFLLCTIAYIKNKNEKQRLEDRISILSGYAINQKLRESPIVRHFIQLLKETPYKLPTLQDWKDLRVLINKEIPNFFEVLKPSNSVLSDFELDVCMLIKLQITSSEIAKLKHCSPSYITQVRKNVFQKLFHKKGRAEELDEFIMFISNEQKSSISSAKNA